MTMDRRMYKELKEAAGSYPVVALLGPRQAGKTTAVREAFPDYTYILLEKPEYREFALSDPQGFLSHHGGGPGLIIDEAQHAPELFSYIQGIVDESNRPGQFILTGSHNFHLSERISQTLAGRVAVLTLLPLSLGEIERGRGLPSDYEELLFSGCYPRIQAEGFGPQKWYQNYITTFVERDVRMIQHVTDLHLFQKFIGLCAGRIGQLLSWSEIARDCGITTKTAQSWMSVLEASYLVFLLQPHHQSFSKRLVKSPKLYFYDTGLACSLLRIQSAEQLNTHYMRGHLFEAFVVSELAKRYYNRGLKPPLYFWRDKAGHEVDCIIDRGDRLVPIEIKSGRTINSDFFSNLRYWNKLADLDPAGSYLVYGGAENQKRSAGHVLGWSHIAEISPFDK